jgi:hypothetical protein
MDRTSLKKKHGHKIIKKHHDSVRMDIRVSQNMDFLRLTLVGHFFRREIYVTHFNE